MTRLTRVLMIVGLSSSYLMVAPCNLAGRDNYLPNVLRVFSLDYVTGLFGGLLG